jgi:hypothetical protein
MTGVVDEMNSGFDSNIGTIKNIVTNAVIDIIKPEIAYDRIAYWE